MAFVWSQVSISFLVQFFFLFLKNMVIILLNLNFRLEELHENQIKNCTKKKIIKIF